MKDKTFLMIPGPTPVPESVMMEIAKHPIGHRSTEFSKILEMGKYFSKWSASFIFEISTSEAATANVITAAHSS